jgi:hypothetical protein
VFNDNLSIREYSAMIQLGCFPTPERTPERTLNVIPTKALYSFFLKTRSKKTCRREVKFYFKLALIRLFAVNFVGNDEVGRDQSMNHKVSREFEEVLSENAKLN